MYLKKKKKKKNQCWTIGKTKTFQKCQCFLTFFKPDIQGPLMT